MKIKAAILFLIACGLVLLYLPHSIAETQHQYENTTVVKNHFDKQKWEEATKGYNYSGKPYVAPQRPTSQIKSVTWFSSPFWKYIFIGLISGL